MPNVPLSRQRVRVGELQPGDQLVAVHSVVDGLSGPLTGEVAGTARAGWGFDVAILGRTSPMWFDYSDEIEVERAAS